MKTSDSRPDDPQARAAATPNPSNSPSANPGGPGVLGWHLILELYECDAARLDDLPAIQEYLLEATRSSGATILDHRFHKFSPQGVSGVIVIAESHVSIHTWPEHRYAAVDYFSCSPEMNSQSLTDSLQKFLAAGRVQARTLERGFVD